MNSLGISCGVLCKTRGCVAKCLRITAIRAVSGSLSGCDLSTLSVSVQSVSCFPQQQCYFTTVGIKANFSRLYSS